MSDGWPNKVARLCEHEIAMMSSTVCDHPIDCPCKDKGCGTRLEFFGPRPTLIPSADPVSAPAHYVLASGVQCLDVIEELQMGFHRGNAFAYIWRAGRKGTAEDEIRDLKKAVTYLNREIKRLEAGKK